MKTFKVLERPLAEERELHISLTLNENDEWVLFHILNVFYDMGSRY